MGKIVDGSTQVFGIVGDPIRQVRAPAVWSALFKANGFNAICVPLHVAPADLAAFVAAWRSLRNVAGLLVTVPHKPEAATLVDTLTPRARLVGAVNVMRREPDRSWTGDILDGEGFVRGLLDSGQIVAGRRALIVGSGGVGTAIAFALAAASVASIHVSDVVADRAAALARRLAAAGVEASVSPPIAAGFDLVVNASPVGMKPEDPIPIDITALRPDMIVGEVIMHPLVTPLLAAARAAGCHAQAGTVTMDFQLVEMRAFFGFPDGDYTPEAVLRVNAE